MSKLTPTDEQARIIDAYRAGKHMVIEAGAGTGKTSTLKMLASAVPDRSALYIAYNKAIAADAAGSFARHVDCRTAHSLAYRAVGYKYRPRLNGPRQPARIVARTLRIQPVRVDASLLLSDTQVARVVLDTVSRFCHSADPEITGKHVPPVTGIIEPVARATLREAVLPLARRAWDDLRRPDGTLAFTHDRYLKLWQLTGPVLDVDTVFLDEGQDADPVIADIFERQRGHAQLVAVGDTNQAIYCQPAGTLVRVPVQAGRGNRPGPRSWGFEERRIETLQVGDRVVSYSQTGRFGAIRKRGSIISAVTRRPWHGPLKSVMTPSGYQSAYTPDHHCIVMLGDALRGQFVVYLARRGEHFRVGSCEGRYASQDDAFGPLLRARQEGADAIWVLSMHATRRAALAEEALTQTFHNLPGRCFLSEVGEDYWKGRPSNRQEAAILLNAFGLSIDAPLVKLHGSSIHTSRTPLVTQARNLLDGMWVLLDDRTVKHSRSETVRVSSWEPIKVTDEWLDGEVISISVDGDHTYIADGIATHNSWRGAIDALSRMDADVRLCLSESFRFGPKVADEANKWLGLLDAKLRLTGRAPHASQIAELAEPDAILCRTNAGAVAELMDAHEAGKRAALVGGGDQIKRLARAALELQRGIPTSHPELMAFATWGQVQEFAEQEAAGSDLKVFVRLIDDHGAEEVIAVMDRLVDERYADVVVSTAHKAKGREWDWVRVAGDFRQPKAADDDQDGDEPAVPRDEAMLAYVTVTRARRVLDRGGLAWVDGWIAEQFALEDLDDPEDNDPEEQPAGQPPASAAVEPLQAGPGLATTAAGFPCRPGVPLIESRRPPTWLADAIAAEHEITRQMGLLDRPRREVGRIA